MVGKKTEVSSLRELVERYRAFAKRTLSILAGAVLTRGIPDVPLLIAYFWIAGISLIVVLLILRSTGKQQLLKRIKRVASRVGDLAAWVGEVGSDFMIGAGIGLLLLIGVLDWLGWLAFVLFVAMAASLLWFGETVQKTRVTKHAA
ncbi:MAG TPA: hypothetical protein VFE96_05245, partial [Candidatus Bathyarchaeia archaeon]|nr:hypothetical protein [Candidatus Bathyarchaeia archaeon]